jgi:hypothetical protein
VVTPVTPTTPPATVQPPPVVATPPAIKSAVPGPTLTQDQELKARELLDQTLTNLPPAPTVVTDPKVRREMDKRAQAEARKKARLEAEREIKARQEIERLEAESKAKARIEARQRLEAEAEAKAKAEAEEGQSAPLPVGSEEKIQLLRLARQELQTRGKTTASGTESGPPS